MASLELRTEKYLQEFKGPPVKRGDDVSGSLPAFLGHLERVWARGLPLLMPIYLFLLPIHTSSCLIAIFVPVFGLFLDTVPSVWASPSDLSLPSCGISLCTFLYWHSGHLFSPHGSVSHAEPLCSSPVPGSHLSSRYIPVCNLGACLPSLHVCTPLCAGSCRSVSLPPHLGAPPPTHLSSNVPSSPLSPNLSAVTPTGSASCSRCSCTAAWGRWPGATSPQ